MKRTTILRNCTFVCGALMLASAWVSYWVTIAFVVLCVIFAAAWLVSDYHDYQLEQKRFNDYLKRKSM